MSNLENYDNKVDLINGLTRRGNISKFAIDIVRGYNNEYNDRIDKQLFQSDLISSLTKRKFFNELECRGFSYILSDNFDFSCKLGSSINFKLALLTDKYLYFPPRLRRYLPRFHRNHIRENKYPSIAFALGRIEGKNLYIFILQSDLFFNGPAVIREYIKGWRKVLFAEIINSMQGKVENIYLSAADEIFRTCHPRHRRPDKTPDIWFQIYDETAVKFKMRKTLLENMIDMQTLYDLPQEFTNKMYHLNFKNEGS